MIGFSKDSDNDIVKAFRLRNKYKHKLREIEIKIENINRDILSDIDIKKYDYTNNISLLDKNKIFKDFNRIDSEFYRPLFDKLELQIKKYGDSYLLCEIFNESFNGKTPAKAESREYGESEKYIVKVKQLTNYGINWSDAENISQKFFDKNSSKVLKENDILMTSSAHTSEHIGKKIDVVIGISKKLESSCLFCGELIVLRKPKININPYYIASMLKSRIGHYQLQRCIRGISSHLYPVDILNYVRLPIPGESVLLEINSINKSALYAYNKSKQIIKNLIVKVEEELDKKFD